MSWSDSNLFRRGPMPPAPKWDTSSHSSSGTFQLRFIPRQNLVERHAVLAHPFLIHLIHQNLLVPFHCVEMIQDRQQRLDGSQQLARFERFDQRFMEFFVGGVSAL